MLTFWRWQWANLSQALKWHECALSSYWWVTPLQSPLSLMDTTVMPTTTAGFLVRMLQSNICYLFRLESLLLFWLQIWDIRSVVSVVERQILLFTIMRYFIVVQLYLIWLIIQLHLCDGFLVWIGFVLWKQFKIFLKYNISQVVSERTKVLHLFRSLSLMFSQSTNLCWDGDIASMSDFKKYKKI